jgi:hypothetical protein
VTQESSTRSAGPDSGGAAFPVSGGRRASLRDYASGLALKARDSAPRIAEIPVGIDPPSSPSPRRSRDRPQALTLPRCEVIRKKARRWRAPGLRSGVRPEGRRPATLAPVLAGRGDRLVAKLGGILRVLPRAFVVGIAKLTAPTIKGLHGPVVLGMAAINRESHFRAETPLKLALRRSRVLIVRPRVGTVEAAPLLIASDNRGSSPSTT